MVTVLETLAPGRGEEMETVGAVVSVSGDGDPLAPENVILCHLSMSLKALEFLGIPRKKMASRVGWYTPMGLV
jgi:hypothetical protein